jgi:outer membrane protein
MGIKPTARGFCGPARRQSLRVPAGAEWRQATRRVAGINRSHPEESMNKKSGLGRSLTLLAAAAASALVTLPAAAQSGDTGNWLVRGRALYLDSANKDSTGLGLSVNNKLFPEVDISWFATPNLAVELILTYPQKHDIRSNGVVIGELKHLPPTLLGQYHFTGLGGFRPYVGAGLNVTFISGVKFVPAVQAALNPRVEKRSVGFAVQAGVDVPVGGWLLNVDVKKVRLEADIFAGSTKAGVFKIDPTLFSVGLGKRF